MVSSDHAASVTSTINHVTFSTSLPAVVRLTCRTTAFRPPVSTLGSTCVPPTVNCLQYLATGSTLTAVGPFQLPAPQSGTLSQISFGTRPSVQTLSDVCLKRTCSLNTSAFSALEALDDNEAVLIYLLTSSASSLHAVKQCCQRNTRNTITSLHETACLPCTNMPHMQQSL